MFRLIKRNYFLLVSIFLIFYFAFNFVSGERGLFSFIEKKELLSNLKKEEISLTNKIRDLGQSKYINSFFFGKGFFKLQEDIINIDKNVNINALNIMIVNTIKLS